MVSGRLDCFFISFMTGHLRVSTSQTGDLSCTLSWTIGMRVLKPSSVTIINLGRKLNGVSSLKNNDNFSYSLAMFLGKF